MKCPICENVDLQTTILAEYGFAILDACPNCQGAWFDKGELDQLDASVWINFEKIELQHVHPEHKTIQCPKCSVDLEPLAPKDVKNLIIDRCPSCQGFWLEKGELGRIQGVAIEIESSTAKKMTLLQRLLFLLVFILIGIIVFFVLPQTSPLKKEKVYIAVAGPMTGPDQAQGEIMLKAIKLYLKQIGGEVAGKKIELLIFDDQSDPDIAAQVASAIASEQKALLVLGHYHSPTSLAAGSIYQTHEIPAITASARAEAITAENDWYFRVVPNRSFVGAFAAYYIRYTLNKQAATVVYVNDSYGSSLAKRFQMDAKRLGIAIRKTWRLFPDSEHLDQDLEQIGRDLRAMDDPGAIFLAMQSWYVPKILAPLLSHEKTYDIINPELRLEEILKGLRELSVSVSLANGIYSTSPFILELGNELAYAFGKDFERAYREKPSWDAASYYDAIHVAVEAIKRAQIQGERYLRSDRPKIRNALTEFFSPQNAVKGVTGYIYFDRQGDVNKAQAVEIIENQRLSPAFFQYQQVAAPENIDNRFEKILKGELVVIDNVVLKQTRLVYAGIDIREIKNIDLKNSSYTLDLIVWFRFQGDFNASEIEFINAVEPITLGQPILEETIDSTTIRAYRLQAEFKGIFAFHRYPLVLPALLLSLRHTQQTSDTLVFVPDIAGIPRALQAENAEMPSLYDMHDWHVTDIGIYHDIISNVSTLGNPKNFKSPQIFNYSRLNAVTQLKPNVLKDVVKLLWPVFVGLLMICAANVLPVNWIGGRVVVYMITLITTAGAHYLFVLDLPVEYLTLFEYGLFIIYGLLIVSVFHSASAYAFYKNRLALLQHIKLFDPFSDKMKSSLCKKMRRRRYKKPGKTIVRQGERGDSLFVIIEGEVSVQVHLEDGTSLEVTRIGSGGFFGEMALLLGETRTASIISKTPCFVGEVTKAHITPFLKKHPEILGTMSKELTRRKLSNIQRENPSLMQLIDPEVLARAISNRIETFWGIPHQEIIKKQTED